MRKINVHILNHFSHGTSATLRKLYFMLYRPKLISVPERENLKATVNYFNISIKEKIFHRNFILLVNKYTIKDYLLMIYSTALTRASPTSIAMAASALA